jgi:alpha-1,2-mannosyltransferase
MVLGTTVAAGLLLRLLPTLRGGSLTGVREYDDGVHYAAGLALVHGRVPYRDFVLLHPPGIALLMAPFASVGELIGQANAMGVARIFILTVATANMVLTARLARPWGSSAAVAATVAYAVWPGAVVAERTVMLEPLLNLFCLLALLAIRQRRGTTAGLLVAAALCVKLFAVTTLLALCAFVIRDKLLRRKFAIGVMGGLAVIGGPFLAAAPAGMWHDVVVVQATRPPAGLTGTMHRLVGATSATGHRTTPSFLIVVVVVVVVLAAARDSRAWPWLIMLSTTALAFFVGASSFVHYSGYLAVPVAMLTAAALSRRRRGHRLLIAACTCTAVLLAVSVVAATPRAGTPALRAFALPTGCTWSENPSILVSLDRLSPPTRSCPQPVDPRGSVLAVATVASRHFYPNGFRGVSTAQQTIHDQLARARFIILTGRLDKDPMLDQGNQTFVRTHFAPLGSRGSVSVWLRRGQ